DEIAHRLIAERVAGPELARGEGAEVRDVLAVERVAAVEVEEDRLVDPVPLPEGLDRRRAEAWVAQPRLRRVPGEDPEQEEVEGDDDEDGDEGPRHLAQQVAPAPAHRAPRAGDPIGPRAVPGGRASTPTPGRQRPIRL